MTSTQSKATSLGSKVYIPDDDPELPVAPLNVQTITDNQVLAFLSNGGVQARLSPGTSPGPSAAASTNPGVISINQGLVASDADDEDEEYISASQYSIGSYTGSYNIFGNVLDAFGFNSVSGSGFIVNPTTVAQARLAFALTQNLPAAIGDINNGRVGPTDPVVVYEREGPNLGAGVTSGVASAVLMQWSGIVKYIDSEASSTNGDLTVPVGLALPGGARLEMNLAQLYNYLLRSQSSLYQGNISQAVTNFFVNELGRGPSSTDSSGWYSNLYNTGSDIFLRQTLATSPEATNRFTASFQNTLNRSIDGGTVTWVQNDLVNGNFTQASWLSYLAYLPEAAADLNAAFENILSRALDAAGQANAQANLANGSLTQAAWLSLVAYSAEAAADVSAIYLNDLGRPVDAPSLANLQYWFSVGGTMAAERSAVAYSQEAANAMNASWIGETGQAIDPGNLAWWQQQFAAGYTLSSLQGALAYSWAPTVTAINNVYWNVLGRPADPAALAAAQSNFAAGGTLSQLTAATANSQEAVAALNAAYENILGRPIDGPGLANVQAALASGALTLQGEYNSLAFSPEAAGNIDTLYADVVGSSGISGEELSGVQSALASNNVPGAVTQILGSPEGQAGLSNAANFVLSQPLTASQQSQLAQNLATNGGANGTQSWANIAGGLLNNFLGFINPIAVAEAAPTKPVDKSTAYPTLELSQVAPITLPPGDPIAFVGGFADGTSQIVLQEYKAYVAVHGINSAQYFSWTDSSSLTSYINQNQGHVVVIGHSYGGDTAAAAVAISPFKIDMLITLDPVSLFTPSYAKVAANTISWYDYNAVGGSIVQGSNLVAGVGGDWGQGVAKYLTAGHFANVDLNHADIGSAPFIQHLIGR